MNSERREEIEKAADMVRQVYNIGSPIENMVDVVKKMGGTVILDRSITDGKVVKTTYNSFTVYVATSEYFINSIYTRYVIAHELGHLFLHMYYQSNTKKWKQIGVKQSFKKYQYAKKEVEADTFAMALLMPREEFSKTAKATAKVKNGKEYVNPYTLANHFGVSCRAVEKRGKVLGVFA